MLGWGLGDALEWVFGLFFWFLPLHYKNTFTAVLQELKYEWSHAPMDIFFLNCCEMKHKETWEMSESIMNPELNQLFWFHFNALTVILLLFYDEI